MYELKVIVAAYFKIKSDLRVKKEIENDYYLHIASLFKLPDRYIILRMFREIFLDTIIENFTRV